ncbi:hypothetical protein [Homoserinimonas hongtaonis]|uniref:hypothetical protein n=1 Tax=Homoserinimonas hongtaonis TaxID=2079791 RepID=UPI000D35DD69|nr:hypothetical protein [Salinibacterium hongtaonis]AWB89879.1 hypothetical protein C2138_10335 [Salinibacterium hongtaonis]
MTTSEDARRRTAVPPRENPSQPVSPPLSLSPDLVVPDYIDQDLSLPPIRPPRPERSDRLASSQLRREVLEREERAFGGVKIGSAFFGWLTAVGTGVILVGFAAGILSMLGASLGLDGAGGFTAGDAGVSATATAMLVIALTASYFCGGYVAGRMARFAGAQQGAMVFVWSIAVSIAVGAAASLTGDGFDVAASIEAFPGVILASGGLSLASILAVVAVLTVMLGGAMLGGIVGMRFHRRVDKAGFGE